MTSFQAFSSRFKGDIVTPSDDGYEQAIQRWARNLVKRASIVAYVKDAEDVALALKYAQEAGLEIAVHCGGHSYAGTSSTDGGLVVDLSKYIDYVRTDPETRLAYVGGGAKWGTFDRENMKYGLAGVAGTVHHATVVTADGSILTANDHENSDLFWGIRGGGSNFGVVTEFIMKVFPQRRTLYGGPVMFTPDKVDRIAAFLDVWRPQASDDEGCHVIWTRAPDGGQPIIICFLLYQGSEEEGKTVFKELLDLGPIVNNAKETEYLRVNTMTNELSDPGLHYYGKGALLSRDKPSSDLNSTNFTKWTEITKDPALKTITMMEFISTKKINSIPPDATPYRRDLPGNIMILTQWKGDEKEKLGKARQINHNIANLFVNEIGYGNYGADVEASSAARGAASADRVRALFRENYPRLQQIKKKYDPKMMFHKWYCITPAQ